MKEQAGYAAPLFCLLLWVVTWVWALVPHRKEARLSGGICDSLVKELTRCRKHRESPSREGTGIERGGV